MKPLQDCSASKAGFVFLAERKFSYFCLALPSTVKFHKLP